jgi:PhnB protein
MNNRSLSEQLNQALDRSLDRAELDPQIIELIQIADQLITLPRPEFKKGLRKELERRANIMATEIESTTILAAATPYLCIRDAASAIEFYKQVFGAIEVMRLAEPDGRIGHAQITIGKALIMISDEHPEHGIFSPTSLGGAGGAVHLYVPDVDAVFEKALAAGATTIFPVRDQFYGDRAGRFKDPFGHMWLVATRKEEVTMEEMERRYDEITKQQTMEPTEPPVHYIPEGLRTITPYLHPKGAAKLIEFMIHAFGGQEVARYESPDGTIAHAQVRIGDSVIELGEAHGDIQPMPTAFHLYVKDADAVYRQALAAGARSLREPADMFYGDREASVVDPFGNHWYIATRKSR